MLRRSAIILSLCAGLSAGRSATAGVQYSSRVAWEFDSTGGAPDTGLVASGDQATPATSGARGLTFSRRGGACPAETATDQLCAGAFSAAENNAGRLVLRSAAQLMRRQGIGKGPTVIDEVAADTKIEVTNLAVVGTTVPVPGAFFRFRLHGTVSQTTSNQAVVTQAVGDAMFGGVHVTCPTGICDPIKVKDWTPTFLGLTLNTRASAAAPASLTDYDADVSAIFADTFELEAIELKDASNQPIAGASVVVKDAGGQIVFTFPNVVATTTTTTAIGTTSTTGSATTSTTLSGGSTTTTTTLPGTDCVSEATLTSLRCRLDALRAPVQRDAGKLAPKLLAKLTLATNGVTAAEQATTAKQSKKAIKKIRKGLTGFGALLNSKKAQKTIAEPSRSAWRSVGTAMLGDLAGVIPPA